jgi:hypothetical protein
VLTADNAAPMASISASRVRASPCVAQRLELRETLLYEVFMRRYILSRANVAASGYSVLPNAPLRYVSTRTPCGADYEWPRA